MIVQSSFSPQAMLSAPRRSPAVPNHNGSRALFTVSTYTAGERPSKELMVMEISTGSAFQISHDETIHDANWIGDNSNTVLYLKAGSRGVTRLMTLDVDHPFKEPQHVADIPGPVKGMKLAGLEDGSVAVTLCGLVGAGGKLYNREVEHPTPNTSSTFDTLHSLQSNTPIGSPRETIWFSKLKKDGERWKLLKHFQNALRDTSLEVVLGPAGNQDERLIGNHDVCNQGIVFVARDTEAGDSFRAEISNVYYIPLNSFDTVSWYKPRKLVNRPLDFDGYCSNPRFSPHGSVLGYIKAPYNSPVDTRLYLSHIGSYTSHDVLSKVTCSSWDLSPVGFEFSPKPGWILMTAEDCGRLGLYDLELQQHATPRTLLRSGTVSGCYTLSQHTDDKLLVSSSGFMESSLYQIIDILEKTPPQIVSSATRHGAKLRLSHGQVSEFYFEGAGDYCVHAWMIKPAGFDASRKYPVAVLLHDGPNGAWRDEWSTTYNLALWAAQGYIVVAPNISGSSGFGVPFATAAYQDWGGRPYDDIANCMEFLKGFPFVDTNKIIAAGYGYGGYLVNWIGGSPLSTKFRALVADNGMFGLATCILNHEIPCIGTQPRESPSTLTKWNPAAIERLRRWKTPTLVIHNSLNMRRPISEGMALFDALQRLQVPSRFLQLSDEDSPRTTRPNILLERYRVVFEWISIHTAGEGHCTG